MRMSLKELTDVLEVFMDSGSYHFSSAGAPEYLINDVPDDFRLWLKPGVKALYHYSPIPCTKRTSGKVLCLAMVGYRGYLTTHEVGKCRWKVSAKEASRLGPWRPPKEGRWMGNIFPPEAELASDCSTTLLRIAAKNPEKLDVRSTWGLTREVVDAWHKALVECRFELTFVGQTRGPADALAVFVDQQHNPYYLSASRLKLALEQVEPDGFWGSDPKSPVLLVKGSAPVGLIYTAWGTEIKISKRQIKAAMKKGYTLGGYA